VSWIKDIVNPQQRLWEEFYRNRWQHDKVVRSTHGVNCTGGCSWMIYVKNGIVTWEMQALDYPRLDPGLPPYEPRGCPRGITYSWYIYSPLRIKYPYMRGVLMDLWHEAKAKNADPVEAWASIVEDEKKRKNYQVARGKGGFRRSNWDECLELVAASLLYTARKYGPDRVVGFSPIPAMSMLSYAAGSRFLQLFGGALLSFYDLYADFPPASPEIWGEKTDVAESADWFNSKYIVVEGSNLDMTRTPDAHFAVEARYHGAKLVVFSPDFSDVSKHADWWIPVNAGMDGAVWTAVTHVILKEFYVDRQVPYFEDYLKRFTDAPFLVGLEKSEDGCTAGKFLRANRLARYHDAENGDWKFLVFDESSGAPRMPQGAIGFRWQEKKGQWNLQLKDGLDGSDLEPQLSLIEKHDEVLQISFTDFAGKRSCRRGVPVRYVETSGGRVPVTTVFDLLMAQFGVSRGLAGEYPAGYDDAESFPTPAWQEKYTGVGRNTVAQLAREFATTAEKTKGKCTVIVGSGVNHWYHANLHYRATTASLILCGCVGVNGGGLNHYTGQEKLTPMASWSTLAMALDWSRPPRLQNGPSFHYVHSDQWRYEREFPDYHPPSGPFARKHFMDLQAAAVRMGWLPFYPQFNRNPIHLVHEAEAAGAKNGAEIQQWLVEELRTGKVRFSVEDPDLPENWPRVWLIWRANALHSSAKGQEYFFRHYLGTHDNAIAEEVAADSVQDVVWREASSQGKMDLVVDLNFRMDTSALYSDIVLPSASWYEKNDLNTTDLHSYFHPFGAAVPPCWESRTDWEIFRSLAEEVSQLAPSHFPEPFREVVATPLLHDTPDEISQPEVKDWFKGECQPVPGKTMPHLWVVERDYVNLFHRFNSLGPGLVEHGVEDHGVEMPVADLYEEFARRVPAYEWNGQKFPSLADPLDAANAVLFFAPEANGEVAYRGFKEKERQTGLVLANLAEGQRGTRYDFEALVAQPRRILTSPCWSGITNNGRAYSGYVMNVERLVPWRTLTGRQHFYLDHEGYRAFGESLPIFKPRIELANTLNLVKTGEAKRSLTLLCVTPHGKWHIHSTYADDLRMLTLSRGVEPLWLNDQDAREIGILDNDWVEALNDNGVIATRVAVSARIPRGVCFFYHAPERTVSLPKSPTRRRRAGGTNAVTRMKLKPVLIVGGYAQHCYRFNDYGPPASDRDTYVMVHKMEGQPQWD
jgi:nitrate reductase / nitrite oxidoreductase, alpha subunit